VRESVRGIPVRIGVISEAVCEAAVRYWGGSVTVGVTAWTKHHCSCQIQYNQDVRFMKEKSFSSKQKCNRQCSHIN